MGSIPRRKSGKIYGGSSLIVPGEGIYTVKVIKPSFNKKSQYDTQYTITTTTTPQT